MLQSFIPIQPRSQPEKAYSCLLSLTLESSSSIHHLPLALALAVVHRTLRSGCLPPLQIHLLLSQSWFNRRRNWQSVWSILQEMNSIGYSPDCRTCNYLISSLCKIDEFGEAMAVMRGMGRGSCIPNLDSYRALIGELSEARRVNVVVEVMREMVGLDQLKGWTFISDLHPESYANKMNNGAPIYPNPEIKLN